MLFLNLCGSGNIYKNLLSKRKLPPPIKIDDRYVAIILIISCAKCSESTSLCEKYNILLDILFFVISVCVLAPRSFYLRCCLTVTLLLSILIRFTYSEAASDLKIPASWSHNQLLQSQLRKAEILSI